MIHLRLLPNPRLQLISTLVLGLLHAVAPSAAAAVALAPSLSTAASPYPVVKNPPKWSSESLGGMVFAHTGQSTVYTPTDLKLLAKFQMVQFDKKENVQWMPSVRSSLL